VCSTASRGSARSPASARRYRTGHARHHRGDQRGAYAPRCAGRPGHHRGLRGHAAGCALLLPRRPRWLGQLRQESAAGAAGADHRCDRSASVPMAKSSRRWTKRRCAASCRPCIARRSGGADDLPDQLLHQRRARAPGGRDRRGDFRRYADLRVRRRGAGNAGVRAHGNHRREFLRSPGGGALRQ
jgi:hypothetical protein